MGSEPLFTTRAESRNRITNLALIGELDIAGVPVLEEDLAPLEGDGIATIVLDLRELTFLDCSAVHAFLAAKQRADANGHRLVLVGASENSRRLFELTRTTFLLDEHEALGVLEQFTAAQRRRTGGVGVAEVNADV